MGHGTEKGNPPHHHLAADTDVMAGCLRAEPQTADVIACLSICWVGAGGGKKAFRIRQMTPSPYSF